jgi:hypothetical protein
VVAGTILGVKSIHFRSVGKKFWDSIVVSFQNGCAYGMCEQLFFRWELNEDGRDIEPEGLGPPAVDRWFFVEEQIC